jgi:hypothetical protein
MIKTAKYVAKVIAVAVAGLIFGLMIIGFVHARLTDSPLGIRYKEQPFTMDNGTPCTLIWWGSGITPAGVTCDYGKVKGDDDE